MILALILILVSSACCSFKPSNIFKPERKTPTKTSPNTQSFLSTTLKHINQVKVVNVVRAGPDLISSYSKGRTTGKPSNYYSHADSLQYAHKSKPKRIITDPLERKIDELFSCAWDRSNFLVEEVLAELYETFPDIDHINTLYYDSVLNANITLLHVAVKTTNNSLITVLKNNFESIECDKSDSDGFSPAELAYEEGSITTFKALLESFPLIITKPFKDRRNLIYFAASSNCPVIIDIVHGLGVYDFTSYDEIYKDILTPLELAVKNKYFDVAISLRNIQAISRSYVLELVFLDFLENVAFDPYPCFFMINYISAEFLYKQNSQNLDIMHISLFLESASLVQNLLDLGYNRDLKALIEFSQCPMIRRILFNHSNQPNIQK